MLETRHVLTINGEDHEVDKFELRRLRRDVIEAIGLPDPPWYEQLGFVLLIILAGVGFWAIGVMVAVATGAKPPGVFGD